MLDGTSVRPGMVTDLEIVDILTLDLQYMRSVVQLCLIFVIPWTVGRQATLSMGSSRQEQSHVKKKRKKNTRVEVAISSSWGSS